MKTMAMTFGEMFGSDGQCFRTADGRSLKEAAEGTGARIRYPNGRGTSPIIYSFEDGSAVVECDGGWDYRADGCEAHCWAGVGCDCEERAAQARREDARSAAVDLCNDSAERDAIVRAQWTQELEDEMLSHCDDHADNGEEVEFWGEWGGTDFRVHLVKAGE